MFACRASIPARRLSAMGRPTAEISRLSKHSELICQRDQRSNIVRTRGNYQRRSIYYHIRPTGHRPLLFVPKRLSKERAHFLNGVPGHRIVIFQTMAQNPNTVRKPEASQIKTVVSVRVNNQLDQRTVAGNREMPSSLCPAAIASHSGAGFQSSNAPVSTSVGAVMMPEEPLHLGYKSDTGAEFVGIQVRDGSSL